MPRPRPFPTAASCYPPLGIEQRLETPLTTLLSRVFGDD